jgi:hypothetical protein
MYACIEAVINTHRNYFNSSNVLVKIKCIGIKDIKRHTSRTGDIWIVLAFIFQLIILKIKAQFKSCTQSGKLLRNGYFDFFNNEKKAR